MNTVAAQDRKAGNTSTSTQQAADSRYEFYCSISITPSEDLCQRAKEFLEKNPNTAPSWKQSALRMIARCEMAQAYQNWVEADKTFFALPRLDKLNQLIEAGESYLEKMPTPDVGVVTRLALATGYALLADFYHDTDQVLRYAEKSLQLLEPLTPPDRARSAAVWQRFRAEHQGRLWQFQGLAKLRQSKPDLDAAIAFLTKAAEAKDGLTFKDPNTYILRAEAYELLYAPLRDEYNEPAEDYTRKEKAREKLYPVLENLVTDYARIVVLTEMQPSLKNIHAEAKANFAAYIKASVRYGKLSEDDVLQLFRKEFDLQ